MRTFLFILLLFVSVPAVAQNSPFVDQDYAASDMETFSRLYWTMNMLNLKNDTHIDNFMLINECDIYTDYFHNEFEWRGVRESARNYIRENIGNFPVHVEFMQPLKFGEYDFEANAFEIQDKYKIIDMRRFEVVVPPRQMKEICYRDRRLDGYPKGLALDFNRPLRLETVPVAPGLADRFITENLTGIRQMEQRDQTRKRVFRERNAYIVYKTKIVGFKGIDRGGQGYHRARFIAILDGYEIYADQGKRTLLHFEDFRRSKQDLEAESFEAEVFEGAAPGLGRATDGVLSRPQLPRPR